MTTETITYKQGRPVTKTKFEMGEEDFVYSIRENGTTRKTRIKYQELATERVEYEERHAEFKIFGLLSLFLAVVLLRALYLEGLVPWGSLLWFAIGGSAMAAYNYVKSEYSVIDSKRGTVSVLKDKRHDHIFADLYQRRRHQLREKYGDVDYDNDLESELEKHEWLMREGAISEHEYAQVTSRLKQFHDDHENGIDSHANVKRIN